jgi:hypothetical protein
MSSGQQPAGAGIPPRRQWQPAPYRKPASLLDELADVEPDDDLTPERRATAMGLLIALVTGLAAATAFVIFSVIGSIH